MRNAIFLSRRKGEGYAGGNSGEGKPLVPRSEDLINRAGAAAGCAGAHAYVIEL